VSRLTKEQEAFQDFAFDCIGVNGWWWERGRWSQRSLDDLCRWVRRNKIPPTVAANVVYEAKKFSTFGEFMRDGDVLWTFPVIA
jgi:hypothetical protein